MDHIAGVVLDLSKFYMCFVQSMAEFTVPGRHVDEVSKRGSSNAFYL